MTLDRLLSFYMSRPAARIFPFTKDGRRPGRYSPLHAKQKLWHQYNIIIMNMANIII